ncbi:MAG: rubrerythrin [Nitrospirae bacterium]|nr:rubrerythrin [Nitrospirota bacterium]
MSESMISNSITLLDIIKEAIKKEHESHDYYFRAASVAVRPAAKNMFLKLAEMEKGHAGELMRHLSDLEAQIQVDKALTASF